MKIVIDEKIPFIRGVFEPYAEVIYSAGCAIDNKMIADADALIVRTRTKCSRQLLEGSSIKIIASATIGYDHIDTEWCESNNIKWVNAPGCNSGSVMQYIISSLFHMASKNSLDLRSVTLGVVGVGNVGSKVVRAARAIGMNVLQNDPPRKRREGLKEFISLDKLLTGSDIVTLHVPLNRDDHDKTHYLINSRNLTEMKSDSILINTSRGAVVDNNALRMALSDDLIGGAVLDVWEGEPEADAGLIRLADIATPHIAGYSVDGKANATVKAVREVAETLQIPLHDWQPESLPQPEEPVIDLTVHAGNHQAAELAGMAVSHTFPVAEDDRLFRKEPLKFEFLRDNYRIRREFNSYVVKVSDDDAREILSCLGFNLR
ncbi:MAG TPA: 4-phosphoerythronate dehydrogenase [Bacteroidales bacterium]|nr:4-phosphoerythronate dehydrogenase [Bacteroidales bacterium]